MSGVTPNGGQIPVEPVPSADGASPDNPPIREYEFIVSSQLLAPDNQPIAGEKVTFRWLDAAGAPPGDDSKILEVSADLATLKRKLVNREAPSGGEYAYASTDGKAYAWIRLRLFDEAALPDVTQRLKGLKAVLGEAVRPPKPLAAGLHSTVRPVGTGATSVSRAQQQQQSLLDMLVEQGQAAAETFCEWADGQLEAVAGLPRSYQQVLGFALKRIADGVILMFPLPGYSAALLTGFEDELRAVVAGLLTGMPRGLYVMARDSIEDLASIVIDLPRAVFNFVAEDPKLALQVLGAIVAPSTGIVTYTLDTEFRDRINKAFSKFRGLLEGIAELLSGLWTSLRDNLTFSGVTSALGAWLYADFSRFVGDIATDYLDYKKDGSEYRHFVAGFVAGDVLGYIVSTVGVEALLAWFTAGIGTVVSAVSKLGRLGAIAGSALRLFQRFLAFLRRVGDLVGEVAMAAGRTVKNGLGTVMFALFKLVERMLHPLAEHLVVPLLEGLFELAEAIQKRVVTMLYKWSDTPGDEGARIGLLADALVDDLATAPTRRPLKDVFADILEVVSDTAADSPDGRVVPNLMQCAG